MEKVDYKHGKFTILTTSTDGFDYDDYLDWCEANKQEPASENSNEYLEWMYEEMLLNYESDLDNIKSCKQYNIPVVITGKLGLWDGTHEIMPVVCDNVHDAISKCVDGNDDCEVYFNDGLIEVHAHHHDGTNCFEIKALSAKGLKWNRESELKKEFTKRLPYLYAI